MWGPIRGTQLSITSIGYNLDTSRQEHVYQLRRRIWLMSIPNVERERGINMLWLLLHVLLITFQSPIQLLYLGIGSNYPFCYSSPLPHGHVSVPIHLEL